MANVYEFAGREDKAHKLLVAARSNRLSASTLAAMNDDAWQRLADLAEVSMPSQATRERTVQLSVSFEKEPSDGDPFEGLS